MAKLALSFIYRLRVSLRLLRCSRTLEPTSLIRRSWDITPPFLPTARYGVGEEAGGGGGAGGEREEGAGGG